MTAEFEQTYLPIDQLQPNDWNAQSMDDVTFDRLVEEIRGAEEGGVGFISPVTVVDLGNDTYRILGGEHRWRAARVAGLKRIPALVLPLDDWDEDQQKFVTVRLNILSGKLDPERFIGLYNEMVDKYGEEPLQELFAFTDEQAFKRIVGQMTQDVKKTLPKKLSDEFTEKASKAKSVDDLAGIVQDMFNRYGDTVDQSYMIFVYGKQRHIYIKLDRQGRRAMDRVFQYCAETAVDINDFMAPIVTELARRAEKQLGAAKKAEEERAQEDDIAF